MAHVCLDCGQLCHCGGDIDDIQWGEDSEESDNCTHYRTPGCEGYDDWDDDDFAFSEHPDEEDG